ncbi:uncharacterized protein TNCV_1661761 [Trichonephila clavipes]|nr:uncharacterized protein TNCV_1661761 [Trichonephila clavipes]
MGKAVYLSDFDRGRIVMARRLETSIFETARLVGCSRSTVVSTYAKWMNDGETSSRRHGVGRPHSIKEKGPSRIVSEHTVERTLLATQQTSHVCAFADQASSPTTPALSPGTLRLVHGLQGRELPGQMDHGLSFITPMVVSGYAVI